MNKVISLLLALLSLSNLTLLAQVDCFLFPDDPGCDDFCLQFPNDPGCGGDPCLQFPWDPGCGGDPLIIIDSLITPGIIDLNVESGTQEITLEYDFSEFFFWFGLAPNYGISVSVQNNNATKTSVAYFSDSDPAITFQTADTITGKGSVTFSIDFSGYAEGNYCVDVDFFGSQTVNNIVFANAGFFSVTQLGSPGSSQNSPILPDSVDADGNFIFTDIPGDTSFWMDPPTAFGYVYQTTNAGALIASIDALPQGLDADDLFTLHTDFQTFENVSVNDSFDFSAQPGGGVRWFAITDVSPVDATDAGAFPIQMTFTATADLCVTSLKTPEASMTTEAVDSGDSRGSGSYAHVSWTPQTELEYKLESSIDVSTWVPANTAVGDVWLSASYSGITAFTSDSAMFYRLRARFNGPVLKVDGGAGPGGETYVPDPNWPFGPAL